MQEQIEISTERLLLKSYTPSFVHHFFKENTKEEIKAYFGLDEPGYERLKLMDENGMETFRLSSFHFLILSKVDKRVLGECGFHTWNNTHRRAEVFYHLNLDSDKNRGYMKETLKEVLNYGFNVMGLNRIEANAADDNLPSIKLLQYFKFLKEGTKREDYLIDGIFYNSESYSLLKNEWRIANQ